MTKNTKVQQMFKKKNKKIDKRNPKLGILFEIDILSSNFYREIRYFIGKIRYTLGFSPFTWVHSFN